MATPSICLYIALLKRNSTDFLAAVCNSVKSALANVLLDVTTRNSFDEPGNSFCVFLTLITPLLPLTRNPIVIVFLRHGILDIRA